MANVRNRLNFPGIYERRSQEGMRLSQLRPMTKPGLIISDFRPSRSTMTTTSLGPQPAIRVRYGGLASGHVRQERMEDCRISLHKPTILDYYSVDTRCLCYLLTNSTTAPEERSRRSA